jgi:uncharacterized membrane protein YfcA
MDAGAASFLFAASAAAGAVNSVAGGGTLLSFPAAIAAGLPPIVANATNAVAMVPGSLAAAWTFRREAARHRRLTLALLGPAIAGGLAGAAILRHTPERVFEAVVPWLVFGATLVILLQELLLGRWTRASGAPAPDAAPATAPKSPAGSRRARLVLVLVCQLVLAVYGGYFGAAMGIVMLAFLGLVGAGDFHQTNAVKNVMAVAINGVASADFLLHGLVDLRVAALMTAGSILGGLAGARLARRASARHVRRLVVIIGFGMAALLAYRRYG